MVKNFLSKILARDLNGLNIISTYCEDSTTGVSEIKYLKKNKIFLVYLIRKSLKDNKKSNIISVCKFEFIENVVAKNVDQKDSKLKLKLMGIDVMKIDKQYEINLLLFCICNLILFKTFLFLEISLNFSKTESGEKSEHSSSQTLSILSSFPPIKSIPKFIGFL